LPCICDASAGKSKLIARLHPKSRAPSSRCGQSLRGPPYSGVCIDSRKGNIAITINNRVTSASCIVGSQLSTGKAFTGVPNIAPPSRAAHPTEVVVIAGQTKLYPESGTQLAATGG
jgi:hypothetical protein